MRRAEFDVGVGELRAGGHGEWRKATIHRKEIVVFMSVVAFRGEANELYGFIGEMPRARARGRHHHSPCKR